MNKSFKSYAKINLGLEILDQRPDGYHTINSVFLPITLADEIHFQKAKSFAISIEPKTIDLPTNENIIFKTVKLIQNKYKININSLNIHLVKNIPIGAGLGGGSSNAATTIVALNELFGLTLSIPQMREFALLVGADVPFFIDPKPSIVTGIGEIIEEVEFPFDFFVLIIYPKFQISTSFAFSLVQSFGIQEKTDYRKALKKVKKISDFEKYFKNDFEKFLFPKFPILEEIKMKMYHLGAEFASLSGSGSTIYGFFSKEIDGNLANELFADFFVFWAKVLTK
ncbi:MAG: 4-(cytidine 5'-diphospho)-2-C-methyl-D-erythritol kinase [Candidatus Kapaibacteriota bacterium]